MWHQTPQGLIQVDEVNLNRLPILTSSWNTACTDIYREPLSILKRKTSQHHQNCLIPDSKYISLCTSHFFYTRHRLFLKLYLIIRSVWIFYRAPKVLILTYGKTIFKKGKVL